MTTTIVSTDIDTTALPFTLENPGDVLILTDEGSITSESAVNPAIYSDAAGVAAIINGQVIGVESAIVFEGGDTSVEIGATATVTAVTGVSVPGTPFRDAAILLANGGNSFVNYGTIQAYDCSAVWMTGPEDGLFQNQLVNYGTITSFSGAAVLYFNNVSATVTNFGVIVGDTGIRGGNHALTVVNMGSITAGGYSIYGSTVDDTVTNGGILTGEVRLDDGNDIFDGRGGTVNGAVYGGWDSDIYYIDDASIVLIEEPDSDDFRDGVYSEVDYALSDNFEFLHLIGPAITGIGNEAVNDIYGNGLDNTLDGAGQSDYIYGGGGHDEIFGGQGLDRLYGSTGMDRIFGGADGDYIFGEGDDDYLRGGYSSDRVYGGEDDDTLIGAEQNDTLYGDNGNDTLNGGDDVDVLFGGNCADILIGGAGGDRLTGGAGYDQLTGGLDKDVFVFTSLGDSAGSNPDSIQDLKRGFDRIDLSLIDANGSTGQNDQFSFIGTGSFTKAGQVKIVTSGSSTNVYLNTDADAGSEMVFIVRNTTTLTASDFIL